MTALDYSPSYDFIHASLSIAFSLVQSTDALCLREADTLSMVVQTFHKCNIYSVCAMCLALCLMIYINCIKSNAFYSIIKLLLNYLEFRVRERALPSIGSLSGWPQLPILGKTKARSQKTDLRLPWAFFATFPKPLARI